MAKVLIIDDSRTSRRMLRNLLTEDGYEIVAEAENGEEGVEKYKETSPDFVTMDITMPVMNGLDALKAIMEYDSKARVVMVTAAGQESKIVEAVKLGASEFITKPFEKDAILATFSKLLNN